VYRGEDRGNRDAKMRKQDEQIEWDEKANISEEESVEEKTDRNKNNLIREEQMKERAPNERRKKAEWGVMQGRGKKGKGLGWMN